MSCIVPTYWGHGHGIGDLTDVEKSSIYSLHSALSFFWNSGEPSKRFMSSDSSGESSLKPSDFHSLSPLSSRKPSVEDPRAACLIMQTDLALL